MNFSILCVSQKCEPSCIVVLGSCVLHARFRLPCSCPPVAPVPNPRHTPLRFVQGRCLFFALRSLQARCCYGLTSLLCALVGSNRFITEDYGRVHGVAHVIPAFSLWFLVTDRSCGSPYPGKQFWEH
jgi:hypothetical protein